MEIGSYFNIDMERTGQRLKNYMDFRNISVKDIQQYLGLTCPQSIYRWIKGKALPSVNHLYMLSRLLKISMEELLVSTEEAGEMSDRQKQIYRVLKYLQAFGLSGQ